MTRFLLALSLLLALALPAHAARPAKRIEAAALVKKLGTWKVRCYAPAAPAGRRCTLSRGYLPAILEMDDKGTRLIQADTKGSCSEPWRYRVDGKDLAVVPAADRTKVLVAGHELTRERPMGRGCKLRRERVNIAGARPAYRLLLATWLQFRTPAAPRN